MVAMSQIYFTSVRLVISVDPIHFLRILRDDGVSEMHKVMIR